MKRFVIAVLVLTTIPAFAMAKKAAKSNEKSLLCSVTRMGEKVAQIEIDPSDFVPATDKDDTHSYCATPYTVDYTDWDPSCTALQQEQRVKICEYNEDSVPVVNQRYSIGPKGFSDDPSVSPDVPNEYIAYDPSNPVRELEKGKVASMTDSDIVPAYGPNVDVVCVIGNQAQLDAQTAAYEAQLLKKRAVDYDKEYNNRKQTCSH
jgi:hypothetical protein